MSRPSTPAIDTPELRALFDELAELDADARRERLANIDLPHAQRERLIVLLNASDGHLPLLDMTLSLALQHLRDDSAIARNWIGKRVGPFDVVSELGYGGSGLVFRAERSVADRVQVVALKLLRNLYSAEAQRRFQREQSILATLDHPSIARLVEAGVSDSGMPYIAMEYVDGLTFTAFSDQKALNLVQRLRLFVSLCRAVDAAHAALIVHRDLKPSNVLVNRQGEIKILDFGIAKLLEGSDSETDTRTQSIVLTPGYAAPEQFKPGPTTVAIDVYALGVILVELLTGKRPHASAWRITSHWIVSQAQMTPPSGLPERRLLAKQLRGDLDAIIASAIAEEPENRYRSTAALADDIERHLSGRAVLAHPPTRWYRTRKFVKRHRGGVAVIALVSLTILASLAIALIQAQRAQQEAALASATRDFLVAVFREVEPAGPKLPPPTVVEVVDAAMARVDANTVHPRVKLDLKTQLGSVMRKQSRLERAVAILQEASMEGAAQFGDDDPMVFDAKILFGETLIVAGRYDEADALVHDLAAIAQRQEPRRRIDYELFALNIDIKRGRVREAAQRVRQAEGLCSSRCDEALQLALSTAKAVTLTDLDRHAEAATAYQHSVQLARKVYGEQHVEVATAMNGLSGAYRRLGRFEEAKTLAQQVIAIDDRILPPLHWRRSIHWNYLGNALTALHEDAAAEAAFRRAIDIARAVSGDQDPSLSWDLSNIGVLLSRQGRIEDAQKAFDEAIRHAELGYGPGNRNTARIRAIYAFNLALHGDSESASAWIQTAIADLRAAEHSEGYLFDALRQQAHMLLIDDAPEASLKVSEEALQVAAKLGSSIAEQRRLSVDVLRATALWRSQGAESALPLIERTLQRLLMLQVQDNTVAEAHFLLGRMSVASECAKAAEQLRAGQAKLASRNFVFDYLRQSEAELISALRTQGCVDATP